MMTQRYIHRVFLKASEFPAPARSRRRLSDLRTTNSSMNGNVRGDSSTRSSANGSDARYESKVPGPGADFIFAALVHWPAKTSAARPRQPFIPASSAPHEADARRIRDANKWSGQRRGGRRGHRRLPRGGFSKSDISAPFGMRQSGLVPQPTPYQDRNVENVIISISTPGTQSLFLRNSELNRLLKKTPF